MSIANDKNIQMVDLQRQYLRLKPELDAAMQEVIADARFINGPQVQAFAGHLANFLGTTHVIPCGNGTDALQIALMSLGLQSGEEVIVPAFTYVAAAETVAMLDLVPVFVDVDGGTYNLDADLIEQSITSRTRAIIPVHLFGQTCDMEAIMRIAKKYQLHVIEDNAQSIGATFTFSSGESHKAGTIGDIGTTSFFPSKPLACYGDGGAMMTSDDALAERLRMIANHGQEKKYHHKMIGCNSRLDTLQAAVLEVKLKHLHEFNQARARVARRYDRIFSALPEIMIPQKTPYSSHVYHQYTIRIKGGHRDALQAWLKEKGIPSMVYYPLALDKQEAFRMRSRKINDLPVANQLAASVLSLPIHTEMQDYEQDYIIEQVITFFRQNR